ncbi:Hypothetical_protein [Hexamita inflata]|uniref:Hypothetical_protein n=1 Tax=Hexamita inflata TaxID=28002 RepID=A0AA86TJD2_9EUKA|nr:Hypothetical protein HINF_LOCUS6870 [Hexamita inflata]
MLIQKRFQISLIFGFSVNFEQFYAICRNIKSKYLQVTKVFSFRGQINSFKICQKANLVNIDICVTQFQELQALQVLYIRIFQIYISHSLNFRLYQFGLLQELQVHANDIE